MTDLPPRLLVWKTAGRFIEADGDRWFRLVSGAAREDDSRPWLVCPHGFPTSSWNGQHLLRTPVVGALTARLTGIGHHAQLEAPEAIAGVLNRPV